MISEFEASLVCRVSSRIARATQRNPVSKKQNKTKQTKKERKKAWFMGLFYSLTPSHTVSNLSRFYQHLPPSPT